MNSRAMEMTGKEKRKGYLQRDPIAACSQLLMGEYRFNHVQQSAQLKSEQRATSRGRGRGSKQGQEHPGWHRGHQRQPNPQEEHRQLVRLPLHPRERVLGTSTFKNGWELQRASAALKEFLPRSTWARRGVPDRDEQQGGRDEDGLGASRRRRWARDERLDAGTSSGSGDALERDRAPGRRDRARDYRLDAGAAQGTRAGRGAERRTRGRAPGRSPGAGPSARTAGRKTIDSKFESRV